LPSKSVVSSAPPGLTVLPFTMEPGQAGDPFRRWAVEECANLLQALQGLLREAGEQADIAVVVSFGATGDRWERAAMESALEAVRGAVHSLTPEVGAAARLNVIACRTGDDERVAAALRYIASPGGAYVAGSTFDLRQDS